MVFFWRQSIPLVAQCRPIERAEPTVADPAIPRFGRSSDLGVRSVCPQPFGPRHCAMADPLAPPFIGPALSDDRVAVVDLFAEDLTDLHLPVNKQALAAVFDELLADDRSVVLVARDGATGCAAGVLVASRVPSVKFSGWSLWIEELFVGKTLRQRGMGRALVEALLATARAGGYAGIDLEAYHGNAPAALLYRNLGFRRLGRERFYYRLEWEQQDGGP
ncbi:MAG: N-acetyltransferase [Myxococcales bacterium]|nr:N-acetyltransferase [Myxococcales bacterium]